MVPEKSQDRFLHIGLHTLSKQLLLTNKFPGLISLCNIPEECKYFKPEKETQ
jgi:hypothetical protein